MKKRRVFTVNLCVLLIIFLTAGAAGKPADDNQVVKKLISERIEILNSYYSGNCNEEQSGEALRKIEKDSLLKNDIRLMAAYARTDIDQIADYRVRILSGRRTAYGIIKGKAEVKYLMKSTGGKIRQTHRYFFTAECGKSSKIKMTQFSII